jgi:altered-inheritance-of-mitochondria protein 5
MLRQQSLILKNVIDPPAPEPPSTAREARVSVVESAKDRWNSEIEGLVKKAQTTDWNTVGDRMADRISSLWSKASEKAKEAGNKS